ncbi:Prephenate dehydratase-domain-containing protein [Naematelia encephala]|uniref:Prephenate dehydratase-domain-containing protein n=1 Tax=Naematelia encephala TaxID=71784 RepID=A0A1Y2BM95_9TREE|nr:Prephenate dehydratase-domain-containing protein [Naematelia encephala]
MQAESESSSHARRRVESGQNDTTAQVIAYLGPQGTYGHQVAKRYLSLLPYEIASATRLESCPTISSVLTHRTATHKIVPLENSIHGSVTETLDTLLSSSLSSSSHPSSSSSSSSFPTPPQSSSSNTSKSIGDTLIIGEITLRIQHVLVARKGVSLSDIRWVRSHEQALGQCKRFLNSRIPHAKTQKWASTAGAALSLLDDNENDDLQLEREEGAAICSRAALDEVDGLDIIAEDIQDEPNNYTRFLVLSRHHSISDIHIPQDHHTSPTSFWALETLSDLTCNQTPSSSGPSISIPPLVAVYARPAPPDPTSPNERTPKWFLVEYNGAIKPAPDTKGVYLGVSSWHVQVGDKVQQNGTEKTDADVALVNNHA